MPASGPISVSTTENYREDYANSVQIRTTLWDFLFSFGKIMAPVLDGGAPSIENSVGVFMSPQQAKAVSNLLVQNIAQYEAAFGPIQLEPQLIQPPGRKN